MTTSPDVAERQSPKVRLALGVGVLAWLFGISGAISLFLGLFIMFGSEDSSIGIGGDLSWQVSEVTDAWMYGLLIGGTLAVLLALSVAVFAPRHQATEASSISELLWHLGAFLAVNAFVWIQDIAIGGGVDYAYWLTIPWGIGLAIHALTVYAKHGAEKTKSFGRPQPH